MENNKNGLKIAGIVLLVLALFLGVMWLSTRSELRNYTMQAEQEKAQLRQELDSLMTEHEKIKAEYGDLADSLKVKDSIIQANAIEIKKLLDTKWEYVKVVKKLDRLRGIAQSYLRQMDSLYTINRQLQAENQQMREEIVQEQRRAQQLVKEKEQLATKIEEGASLSIYSLTAETLRERSGGREEATDKGKRIEKIRICFIVAENKLAKPGTRTFYVRIADPNGNILVKGRGDEYSFMFKGEQLQYSATAVLEYQNKATKMCIDYNKLPLQERFIAGTYQVAVYLDNAIVGETTFSVR
ncbi:MAG: hypothetical protein ACP5O2_00040 [Bacteroidales bacterium]